MNINTQMTPRQLVKVKSQVASHNNKLKAQGRKIGNNMGQDKYLKLLVTQLRYQDPTNPIKNHAFIAQMAQFSSLEQMTKMNTSIMKVVDSNKSAEAYSLLGKKIEWVDNNTKKFFKGIASSLSLAKGKPVLNVDGKKVSLENILKVSISPKTEKALHGKR